MMQVVCLQYSMSILTEIFVQSNIECVSSVRYFFCSIGFNLIYEYLFNGDVELVYLSNLKVLILVGNGLNGSLPFKGKHSIYF